MQVHCSLVVVVYDETFMFSLIRLYEECEAVLFRFLSAVGLTISCLLLSSCNRHEAVQQKYKQEAALENIAVRLAREVAEGGYQLLTTEELFLKQQGSSSGFLVDVREPKSYEQGHIPGARNFTFPKGVIMDKGWHARLMSDKTLSDFAEFLGEGKNRVLVFSCGRARCERGHNGALWAVRLGYRRVFRHPGGVEAWMGERYPLLR